MKQHNPTLQHPKCSVVIPTHNCLQFLKHAIESAQQQTLMNLEIIVVDDHSNDGTWRWLNQQATQDDRIRPIRVQVKNPAKARNIGVRRARGEWIAFLDADDSWLPSKLDNQVKFHLNHPDVAFSFSDYRHFDVNGKNLGTCFEFWPGYQALCNDPKGYQALSQSPEKLFAQNIVGTSTVMVKRSSFIEVGGFDEDLISAEDWDLWLKLALNYQVGIGNYCETFYLMRPESESSKKESRIQAMRTIYRRYRRAQACATLSAIRAAQSRISVAEAEKWLSLKKPARAFFSHSRALLLTPSPRRLMEAISTLRLWIFSRLAPQE